MKGGSLVARAVAGLMLVGLMAGGGAWLMDRSIEPVDLSGAEPDSSRRQRLKSVKSWGYQLQALSVAEAARSPFDLLVIDEAFEGGTRPSGKSRSLASLQRKANGERRLVLAYLSIGEAETYRPYWNRSWVAAAPLRAPASGSAADGRLRETARSANPLGPSQATAAVAKPTRVPAPTAPAWLAEENPEWRGNFYVRYWDKDWQALIVGSPDAALDRIVAAGFDGVYLDRADAYQHWSRQRPGAKSEMAGFIEKISARARSLSPGFLVVMQNAEEQLAEPRVRRAIDAIAKEDLLYGIDGTEAPNSTRDVNASIGYLNIARRDGLPVLVVEYLSEQAAVATTRKRLVELGYVPYFAPRALDRLRGPD